MNEFDNKSETAPGARAAHTCDAVNQKLYVFGGWNGKIALNDLWCYDICKKKWNEIHPEGYSPIARNNHASVVVDQKIYIHGGHDGQRWLFDLHAFDTAMSTWSVISTGGAGPSARACHSISKIGNKLYFFGGYDGSICFNDVDILDLDTHIWIRAPTYGQPPPPRNAHTMSIHGTSLYMFGGHSGVKHLRDFYVLHTDHMRWVALTNLQGVFPPGLRGHTACLYNGCIYLFGGYDGCGRSNELYIFNISDMRWERPPQMDNYDICGRQRHSACLVYSKIYIVGGFNGTRWLDDVQLIDLTRVNEYPIKRLAQNQLLLSMKTFINCQADSDVTFIVEGQKIYGHKLLFKQCEAFRAMFSSGMRESHSNIVHISDTKYDTFLKFLEFFYTGFVEDLEFQDALDLFELADQYSVAQLSKLSENVLKHELNESNVATVLLISTQLENKPLREYCLRYISANFQQIVQIKGFETLRNYPDLLMEVTCISTKPNIGNNITK